MKTGQSTVPGEFPIASGGVSLSMASSSSIGAPTPTSSVTSTHEEDETAEDAKHSFATLVHRPKPRPVLLPNIVTQKPTPSPPAEASTALKSTPRAKVHKTFPDVNRRTLERKLGHIFEDSNLLWGVVQAQGNGVRTIGDRNVEDGNKKLALLGDCCIRMAVLNDWFEAGLTRRQGHELSSSVGRNAHLYKCGRAAGLEVLINPNRSFHNGGRDNPRRTMAATVEALIGAVFVDSGESLRATQVAMKGLGLMGVAEIV